MRLTIETDTYNERRYGKPWIARVDFARGNPKGDFAWGSWVGTPGSDGLLVIDVAEGDIVATGQRDHRGAASKSAPDWWQVHDGRLASVGTKAQAYKLAEARDAGALRLRAEHPGQ